MGFFGKKDKEEEIEEESEEEDESDEEESEEEVDTFNFKERDCNFQRKDSDGDTVCELNGGDNYEPLCEGKGKCPFWK